MKPNERVLLILNETGMTRTKLSKVTGISRGTIRRFIKTGDATLNTLDAILFALGYEIDIKRR